MGPHKHNVQQLLVPLDSSGIYSWSFRTSPKLDDGPQSTRGCWGPRGRMFLIFRLSPQGKHKCECKSHYVGDGLDCEPEQLPIDRCLQDNGQCHADASCADLHFQGQCGQGLWPKAPGLWARGSGSTQEQKKKIFFNCKKIFIKFFN